jgi:hypothetical protein
LVVRWAVGAIALAALAGCGGGNDEAADAAPSGTGNVADELQDRQQRSGGGNATLVVGDQTWKFDSVLCAFGDETQNPDWDFSLSAVQDGLQLSVSRGSEGGRFGDSITMDDMKDPAAASVSWGAPAFVAPSAANPMGETGPFVEVDGKQVSAKADFQNGTSDDPTDTAPGTLTATCP